jgi:hypothetical protein
MIRDYGLRIFEFSFPDSGLRQFERDEACPLDAFVERGTLAWHQA